MMRIVLTEYPKSGGTWIVSMLGDLLTMPKRDIYVNASHPFAQDGKGFDIRKHPWYKDSASLELTNDCVIKSHELPNSPLICFPARISHLIRDGRDVIVSKFFYERDFCVANGIYERFDISFNDYVRQTAKEWRDYVSAWLEVGVPLYKYEDFLQDANASLRKMTSELGLSAAEPQIQQAVDLNTKDRLRRSLEQAVTHNTFVRKGISGDWRNHFDADQIRVFKELAGDLLIRLEYESDSDW